MKGNNKLVIEGLNIDGDIHAIRDGFFYRATFEKECLSIDLYQTTGDKMVRKGRNSWWLNPNSMTFEMIHAHQMIEKPMQRAA